MAEGGSDPADAEDAALEGEGDEDPLLAVRAPAPRRTAPHIAIVPANRPPHIPSTAAITTSIGITISAANILGPIK